MEYKEYAQQLNTFSYQYSKQALSQVVSEVNQRIILSKLYYSLVHYYFSKYPNIPASTGGQKHETLLLKLEKEDTDKEYGQITTH